MEVQAVSSFILKNRFSFFFFKDTKMASKRTGKEREEQPEKRTKLTAPNDTVEGIYSIIFLY
jgi:hypothetical protein